MVDKPQNCAIIGIGNTLMKDEGVGVHVANALLSGYNFPPEVEVMDGGTMGMELMRHFEDHKIVIIVDAVDFHKEPGFIGSIEDDEILKILNTKLTMHHLGITDVLATLKLRDNQPDHIFLLGIQPESIDLDTEMSELVQSKMPRLIEIILLKLKEWGFEVTKK
jgi:hydrogenase maturation protease